MPRPGALAWGLALLAAACSAPPPQADGAGDLAPFGGGDAAAALRLTSPAFVDQGTLPVDYTCDGAGQSPALSWTGAPGGTVEHALLMTTLARDGLKWNWVLHSIPGAVGALARGTTGVGVEGLTSDGPKLAYSPPCSQGPGAKLYTFTIYALSGHPELPMPASRVSGDVLTAAIRPLTLASAQVTVSYTR